MKSTVVILIKNIKKKIDVSLSNISLEIAEVVRGHPDLIYNIIPGKNYVLIANLK